ncbi:MAG: class I SAM-dependent methyltransferase [Alphaproteobacteria bacterium]|nr:class I SAM-dependent methyltransferase [Alphaproteobacteria bacterium]
MRPGEPSRTALLVAGMRAAHPVLDGNCIFNDPLAARILGADAEDAIRRAAEAPPAARLLRLFVAARSRFAADALADAPETKQYVVLGAGLDTSAYRPDIDPGVKLFEVDHPSTQGWKRRRLAEAAIPIPASLTFVPVDFERATFLDSLLRAGFDPALRTFFTWLGVVPYLSEQAVFETLRIVAGLPGGAEIVFDYTNPPDMMRPRTRAAHEDLAAWVAAAGETFSAYFNSGALCQRLETLGYCDIEDLGPAAIAERYFGARPAPERRGAHIVRAATFPSSPARAAVQAAPAGRTAS